jgi:hypothetical protein
LKAVLFRSTRHDRKKAVAVVEDAPVVADGDFLADEEAAGDVAATRRNAEVLRRSAILNPRHHVL